MKVRAQAIPRSFGRTQIFPLGDPELGLPISSFCPLVSAFSAISYALWAQKG